MGKHKFNHNESGIASIFVVMTLMTILALISISFSHLMNREVRQSIDRQLSVAADYAAESGVNDARDYLINGNGASFPGCATPNGDKHFVNNGDISGDSIEKYTCVAINTSPKELKFNLNAGESATFKMTLPAMDKLHLGWSRPGSLAPLATTSGSLVIGQLPREDQLTPDSTGILRTALYPVIPGSGNAGVDTNAALEQASETYFLYPHGGSGTSEGSVNYTGTSGHAKDGSFVDGNCNGSTFPSLPLTQATKQFCNSVITNLSGVASTYYIKLSAIYSPLVVTLEASDSSNKVLQVPGVEALIDVTANGNDILRRQEAILPLAQGYSSPNYALESMNAVCKLFQVPVTAQGFYGTPVLDPAAPNNDGACSLPSAEGDIVGGGNGSIGDVPCPSGYYGSYPNCTPPPTTTLTASPNSVTPGGSSTLTWSSTNTSSCVGSGFNTGNQTNGSVSVSVSSTTTYSITCFGTSGGQQSAQATVTVSSPPPCSANAGGSRSGSFVTITGGGSGCAYYYDSYVGWNGGFSVGPIFSPGTFCHTQQGGTDPWGFLSSQTWCG